MVRRIGIPLFVCALGGSAAACSGSNAGPSPLASCKTTSAVATHITLAVGQYVSLDPATDSGCVLFPANASSTNQAEYLLVPQSATGDTAQVAPFQLTSGALSAARMPAAQRFAGPPSPRATALAFDAYRRGLARRQAAAGGVSPLVAAAPLPAAATAPQPAGPPVLGSLRTFTVCANLLCGGPGGKTTRVTAKVTTVGQHIAIYVDTAAPKPGLDSADLDTLKTVFDARLFPLDTAAFGQPTDVDTNGVVLVLMASAVNSLVTSAACKATGFVAGFFFSPDLDTSATATTYNRGEIFYSIVADSAGTLSCVHTRAELKRELGGTFTHELQHMINFGQHAILRPGTPEDGWLDEGLSKYAEELAGRSYLQQGDTATFSSYAINDVYDAYQYLSATGDSPLLISIDQGTLAEIGASWLFVRYLVDQYGDTLPRKLVRTPLFGGPNVAAQTGQPFPTTLTRWALANWVSDLQGFATPAELTYTSWHFRSRTFPSLNAQDPTHFPLPYPLVPAQSAGTAVNVSGSIRSGSGVYARVLQDASAPGFALAFSSNGSVAPFPTTVGARLNVIRIR